MNILLASSEVHPFSKSGGVADMVAALAKALSRAGHQVGVVTPLYRGIRERFPKLERFDYHIDVPLGVERMQADVWTLQSSELEGLTIYFVDCPEFFDRAGLYNENQLDYPDNARRFIFFSKCVAHLTRHLPWQPEFVHVHDWQPGIVPLLLLHQQLREGWNAAPRTCLTIHNLAYQGNFPRAQYDLTNLPLDYLHPNGAEFWGQLSCLKAGIAFANKLTTVSPRYAREITTHEFGCGMDAILHARQESLKGILNGVDYEEWNTTRNPHLKHAYSAADLTGKAAEKIELQREVGLPVNPTTPLFASVTRLTDQKGVDLQLGALEEMLATNMQFVLLGSGGSEFERAFAGLARRHPGKAAIRLGFDQGLSHRIEAGADFFLMPSRFEPCGLNQMYSERYGTIPIVRATGGLDDTVVDLSENADRASGIKFHDYSVAGLAKAMRKALVLYETPKLMDHLRKNGMAVDFSWTRTAAEYLEVYQDLRDPPNRLLA